MREGLRNRHLSSVWFTLLANSYHWVSLSATLFKIKSISVIIHIYLFQFSIFIIINKVNNRKTNYNYPVRLFFYAGDVFVFPVAFLSEVRRRPSSSHTSRVEGTISVLFLQPVPWLLCYMIGNETRSLGSQQRTYADNDKGNAIQHQRMMLLTRGMKQRNTSALKEY